jgi:acyl homoserine lactone synthase
MHVLAIRKPTTETELEILDRMHRLRAKVFRTRLSWNVRCLDGREFDEFDKLNPTYLIALSSRGEVAGSVRLLPAMGQTMVATVFPQLVHVGNLAAHIGMVESSRFCVDTDIDEGRGSGHIHNATLSMFAGIVEWCLINGYSELVTATDVRLERILSRVGWRLRRLGEPLLINETRSIAGLLPIDRSTFERLRPEGYQSSFHDNRAKAA